MLREADLPTDRFIKVRGGGKKPADAWRNPENQYGPKSVEIQQHGGRGGNIGLVCGEGLIVIDIDDREAAPDILTDLPGTLLVETPGGGSHLYFASEWDVTRRFDWGEIRADGGQVVAPGSTHPNGGTYHISVFADIAEVRKQPIAALIDESESPNNSASSAIEPASFEFAAGDTTPSKDIDLDEPDCKTDPNEALQLENDCGLTLQEVKRFSRKLDRCLSHQSLDEHPSPSETDMATVSLLKMYRFDDSAVRDVLLSWRRVQDRHVPDDYIPRTIRNTRYPPPVPAKLLTALVDQSSWSDRPKVSRETIVSVTRAMENLPQPFTVAEIAAAEASGQFGTSREAVMKRIRRTLDIIDGDYIKKEKRGGQWEVIRLPAFHDLLNYAEH